MNLDNKTRKKILKIIKLAESGIAGEKKNAQEILDGLFKKYDLTLEDFRDELKERYKLKYKGKLEERLLIQIIGKTLNRLHGIQIIKTKRARSYFHIELTKTEYAQIDYLFDIYKRELAKEVENTFKAFIQVNKIYPDIDLDEDDGRLEMDANDYYKMMELIKRMNPINVNAAVGFDGV